MFPEFFIKLPDHSLLTSGKCRLLLHNEVREKCKLQPLPHSRLPGSKCSENIVWPHRKDREQDAFVHHLRTVDTLKGKETFNVVDKFKKQHI
jgi:hypothetical protein